MVQGRHRIHSDPRYAKNPLGSKLAIMAENWQFGSEMVDIFSAEKTIFLGFCNSLLMGPGQDQHHHSAVQTGGVSRGRVHG